MMKKLDHKVNIIPIIAKSDTIAKNELNKFKLKIMQDLIENHVNVYQFPTDDDTVAEMNASMNVCFSFLRNLLLDYYLYSIRLCYHLLWLEVRIW